LIAQWGALLASGDPKAIRLFNETMRALED
jgi:hypothetical protein